MAVFAKNPLATDIAVAPVKGEGGLYEVLPIIAYAGEDMGPCTPIILSYDGTNKRLKVMKAGGSGYTSDAVALAQVNGWTFRDVLNGEKVTIVKRAYFGGYHDPAATPLAVMQRLWLSDATAGVLVDVAPFTGARPVALAFPDGVIGNYPDSPSGASLIEVFTKLG